MVQSVNADIPEAFAFLFEPARIKVAKGGRGSTKSWSFARALILRSLEKKTRILCAREIQRSIKESVHRLLKEQIEMLGLSAVFDITEHSIRCKNGSDFIFMGLFRNVNQIKSLEGVDIAWVEEAESVSDESWDLLTPTIRKEGSEIWISFNPKFADDPTNQRYAVNPPEGAIVRHINYDQNPWFPEVLRHEMEQDQLRDKAAYEHKWLGLAKGGGRRLWSPFTMEHHVREIPMEEIAKHGNCYMGMDPHSHYYPFIVWIAVLPKNARGNWPEDFHKHVYAEWPTVEEIAGPYHDLRKKLMFKGTLADISRAIFAKDGAEHGITVKARLADPRYAKGAGAWNWSTSTEGLVELFAKKENGGILLRLPEEKRLDAQRETLLADMQCNPLQARSPFNEPSFSVSPRCKNVISSLLNHRLEDESDKEDEKYKDPSDALRIAYAGIRPYEANKPDAPKPAVRRLTSAYGI
jgi:hypothetical protein